MSETVEIFDQQEALQEDIAFLACVTSRTFRVCVACPHGDGVPGYGAPVAAWYTVPHFGRYGLCAAHDEAWRARRSGVPGEQVTEASV